MGKQGKISRIPKEIPRQNFDADFRTLSGALAEKGLNKFPGTFDSFTPHREKNGLYRTGLDPKAAYIEDMLQKGLKEEAEMEIKKVTEMRDRLQNAVQFDLGPNSDYYTKLWDREYGKPTRARWIKKTPESPIILDLTDPYDEITYAWLRVHPDIAPSYDTYQRGISSLRCPEIGKVDYFVDDEDITAELMYRQKSAINKAVFTLEQMIPTRRIQVARLLGLDVKSYDTEEVVYNSLDTFIKETSNRNGSKFENVNTFMKIAQLSPETTKVRFLIEEALYYNIYREQKNGRIFHGEVEVGKDKDAVIDHLSSDKYQEDLLALDEMVKQAKERQMAQF